MYKGVHIYDCVHKYMQFLCSLISFCSKISLVCWVFQSFLQKNNCCLLLISQLNLNWLNLWWPSQYCCSTEMFSSSLIFFPDRDRDLWQMAALPVPKWTLAHGLLLAPLVPSALILFNKECPTACHAFVRWWCRSSSSLYLTVSYLLQFLAVSGSWPLYYLCFALWR